ncbi:cytochrome c biogenesis protein CcdA [uncultured Amnibacterium sp.]|uniref:cytochrome c biogenesis protein CcdA n=1 Tax=uncultured Amnibacterium sp. TaxID=1631851 RepID=UPI0035CBB138
MIVTLLFIGLVGGLITGISPCILPVLPVIFLSAGAQAARPSTSGSTTSGPTTSGSTTSERPVPPAAPPNSELWGSTTQAPTAVVATRPVAAQASPQVSSSRPFLVIAGLVVSFSVFTLIGTLVLSLLHLPSDLIRWAGLVVLILIGLGLIVPRLEALLERPFARLPRRNVGTDRGAFGLGLALGAVYVPCAGPVLAAITVAGATARIGASTIVLTLAFAVGSAAPLLVFALAGRRVAERVRAFRARQRQIRVVAGVVLIALAVGLTFNVTDAIQRAIPDYTAALQRAVDDPGALGSGAGGGADGGSARLSTCVASAPTGLTDCGPAPALAGLTSWSNTAQNAPLTLKALRGRVVLLDFWAYSCINCQRAIPHVEAWSKAYATAGLTVIGVHAPEYAFEHSAANVRAGAARLGITYPVALDNDFATWKAYANDAWPADYLIDASGAVRSVALGEGDYGQSEQDIRTLLTAARPGVALPKATDVADTTPTNPAQTREAYLGADRAQTFAGGILTPGSRSYRYAALLPQDQFALNGRWTITGESLTAAAGSGLALHYNAAKVYLDVGGTGTLTVQRGGRTTHFAVSGAPNITAVVDDTKASRDTVRITLSKGLSVYSFTFG